jgi:AraC family transcriptional regulator
LLRVSSRRYDPDQVFASHVHSETLFCVLAGGSYRERIQGRETEHRAGDVLVCPKNTPHSQQIGSHGSYKMLFGPTESTLAYLGDLGLALERAPAIRNEECAVLGQRLAFELGHDDPYSALTREGIAMELLAAFARGEAHIVERPGVPAWLRLARDYLHENLDAPGSLDDMAREVGRHPVHLAREFKRHYGETIGNYQRQLRAAHAAELLARSAMPLTDVALECGFASHANLCRTFKAAYGMTPKAYRELRRTGT